MWLISAQENVKMETKTETLKCLGVIKEDSVLVIGEDQRQDVNNKKNPALMSSKHKFAKLYSETFQKRSHLATTAKIGRK